MSLLPSKPVCREDRVLYYMEWSLLLAWIAAAAWVVAEVAQLVGMLV